MAGCGVLALATVSDAAVPFAGGVVVALPFVAGDAASSCA
jgi:hypothetical protein